MFGLFGLVVLSVINLINPNISATIATYSNLIREFILIVQILFHILENRRHKDLDTVLYHWWAIIA